MKKRSSANPANVALMYRALRSAMIEAGRRMPAFFIIGTLLFQDNQPFPNINLSQVSEDR